MARRTGIGAALGALIGGQPQPNDVAGAQIAGYDDQGRPIYVDPNSGEDITDQVKESGSGVVQKPSFAMRLFNPEGAAQASQMNLEYQTAPARAEQQYRIANAEADDYARHAIAYATGRKPEEVSEDEVQGVRAARGQTIKASGLTPQEYASFIASKEDIKGGGPQASGRTQALRAQGAENEERTYQDQGGDISAGMARAEQAKAAGEQAKTVTTNEAARRRVQAGQLAGEEGRQATEEAALDQEAINRLSRSTGVDPQVIQRDQLSLQRELGRQPSEEDLLDYELKNRLFTATQNTPLQLGIQNNALRAQNDSAPFARQEIINRARQGAAASSQPPGELMTNPTLYRPSVGYTGSNPAQMFQKLGSNVMYNPSNPLYVSQTANKMAGMSSIMNSGNAGGLQLPNGMVALPSSAPATSTITSPTVQQPTLDMYQQLMRRLQQQQAQQGQGQSIPFPTQ